MLELEISAASRIVSDQPPVVIVPSWQTLVSMGIIHIFYLNTSGWSVYAATSNNWSLWVSFSHQDMIEYKDRGTQGSDKLGYH